MQRLELQFYAFFVVVLCGIALGLLFDLLRAARGHYRPGRWLGGLGDLLFWAGATLVLGAGLFLSNWGELRFYVLVGLLLGMGVYYWLASPVVIALARLVLRTISWLLDLCGWLVLKLIWSPLVALAGLLWGALALIGRAVWAGAGWVWQLACMLGNWLLRPLVGPYRCFRLHYLLTKRRWKRTLRQWLFGSPRTRRK